MRLRNLFTKSLLVASIGVVMTACGGDDDDRPTSGGGEPTASPSPSSAPIPTSTPTPTPEADPLFVVKSTDWSTQDGISFFFVTDTLDTDTVYDPLAAQLTLPGYHYVSAIEGSENSELAFLLAIDNTARVQRYLVNEDSEIVFDKEIDLTPLGIADARNAMRSGKIFSAEKGYIIDSASMQVIVYNPTTLELVGSPISLEDHIEANYPDRWSIFPVIDGDRVVVPITFYENDGTAAPLSKLVIIDTETDQVTVDTSTMCGSVSASAVDEAGNVYFASSASAAIPYELEAPGSFAPCIIRMEAGADGWDENYYVDMTSFSENGRPAYGIMTGTGNTAYTLIYSNEAEAITPDNAAGAMRSAVWEFHSVELGNEVGSVTKIEGTEPTTHRLQYSSFTDPDGVVTPWVNRLNTDFTASTVYDTSGEETWEVLTIVPGALETINRLR